MAPPSQPSAARLRLEQLKPLLTWLWDHREGFQRIMSHPGWSRVFQFVSILSFGMAVFVYYQQQDFIQCIATYNDAQSASSAARSQAFDDSLTAMDATIHSVATATTREQVAAALKAYEVAREAARKKREENPAPEPPSQRCG